VKKSEIREMIKEEIQKLKESFPHRSKKATFEVRTFKEFLVSQKGEIPQYPDYFLINKKTGKIEAGYGSYNVPNYTKYAENNKTNYTIVSKSILKNGSPYSDQKQIDYTKKQNWVN